VPRGSFAPGAPIGSGFSALIFFGSFLYQDKKEHIVGSKPPLCQGDATFLNSSLVKPLLASPTTLSRHIVSKLYRPFRACKNRSLHTRGCAPCYLLRPFGAFVYTLSRHIVSKLFRPFRACKIIRSIQGAAPLATYFAPLGLLFTRSPGTSFQNYSAPSGLKTSDKFFNP